MNLSGNETKKRLGKLLEAPESSAANEMASKVVSNDFPDTEELVVLRKEQALNEELEEFEERKSSTRNMEDVNFDEQCGFHKCGLPPAWLQRLATRQMFLIVFCLSSVIQGMFYPYFISCLTTIEKLFQINSRTTGVIMSTTEIGQIGGSLLLTYYGGGGHRPRWIACSMIFIGISVFLCGLPHFLFGEELVNQYLASAPTQEDPLSTANICINSIHDFPAMEKSANDSSLISNYKPLQPCTKSSKYTKVVLGLFSVALLGVGIGQPAIYNLGIPFIDDNVASQDSPTYFGTTIGVRIFGPTLGFILGSLCMRLPIDPFSAPAYNPTDPRWIGAWWLGLVFISLCLISISFIMMLFPKRLPAPVSRMKTSASLPSCDTSSLESKNTFNKKSKKYYTALQQDHVFEDNPQIGEHSTLMCYSPVKTPLSFYSKEEETPESNLSEETDQIKNDECCRQSSALEVKTTIDDKRSLRDFFTVIRRLITNRILVLRTFSSVFHLLPISGLYTFLPKYLETQFRVTVYSAAMISGVGGISVMGVGIFLSGFIIRKLNPSPRTVTFWIAVTAGLYSFGMIILLFLGCAHDDLVGQNGTKGTPSYFKPPCERSCSNCDSSLFSPICSSNGKTFFSACHAGCSSVNLRNNSKELIFSDCECLEEGATASLRFCDISCDSFVWYIIVFCIFVVIHSTSEVGGMLVTLRCVKPEDKAMALGFISVAIGLFGNVPCPILYGAVVDYACTIWRESCDGKGACQLYDPDTFRSYFHGLTAALMFVAFLIDVAVWYYAKDITFEEVEPNDQNTVYKTDKQKSTSLTLEIIEYPPSTSALPAAKESSGELHIQAQMTADSPLKHDIIYKPQTIKANLFEKNKLKSFHIDVEKHKTVSPILRLSPRVNSSLSRLDNDRLRAQSCIFMFNNVSGDYAKLPLTGSISSPTIEAMDITSSRVPQP